MPDTSDIKWTENNTLQREGMESVINPFDEFAIENALRLKDKYENTTVTAVSMGPAQADEILRHAIALGCDDAFLLSDRKFAAADTVATSKTIAAGIKEKAGDFDLIICGQFAVDGDTAQTGPSIAEQLNLPQVTYVTQISDIDIENGFMTVKRDIEDGIETLKVKFPALICVQKSDFNPRPARILGYMKAQDTIIPSYGLDDINLDPEQVGIKGSPTYVSRAFRPEQKQGGEIIQNLDAQQGAEFIWEKLLELKHQSETGRV